MKNVLLKKPRDCYIILTANCNMRCRHCYGEYGITLPEKELDGKEWDKIITELAKQEIFFLNISGGEPTMHPDFAMIIDSLIKNKMLFLLTTNGLFPKKYLEKIKEAKDYCLGIKISLDGPDWESHGYLRRNLIGESNKSIFDTTLNTIKQLNEFGLPITIATCLHKENIQKMQEMKDFILSIKPKSWYIATISLSGTANDNTDLFVSESLLETSFWEKLKQDCEKQNIEVAFVDMPSLVKSNKNRDIYFNCPATRSFCEIYSDGTVSPCPLARVHIPEWLIKKENIKDKGLIKIWRGNAFKKFRDLQHLGCEGCKARGKCDRCIPQSIQWFNDPKTPPPYCIQNAKSLRLKNPDRLTQMLVEKMNETNRKDYLK